MTIAELITEIESNDGRAAIGERARLDDTLTFVYLNVVGPIVDGAGPHTKAKMLVEHFGEENENVVSFIGSQPAILQTPEAEPTPVGTDNRIIQAIANIFPMTGKKVLSKDIRHTADGAVATARIATIAANTYEDLQWIVINNNGTLEAYARDNG